MKFILSIMVMSALAFLIISCSAPTRDLNKDEIKTVDNLKELMDVMATVADPRFKLAKSLEPGNVTKEHFNEFRDMGERVASVAQRLPEFSKGKEFDEFAHTILTHANELKETAHGEKAKETLDKAIEIRKDCKACHDKYKSFF